MNPRIEKLYRSKEVEEILGISSSTLCNWRRWGWIEFMRTRGGHVRFTQEQIQNALKNVQNEVEDAS